MNCFEFREVADSFLNDELLVETNHRVFLHLENCPECRTDFEQRQRLRSKLHQAVTKADEFRIDPTFEAKLRAELRQRAFEKKPWQAILTTHALIPAMLGLLIVGFVAAYLVSRNTVGPENSFLSFRNAFAAIWLSAAGDHENCAVEHLTMWEEDAQIETPEKVVYREKVFMPLQALWPEGVEFIHAHDCDYDGITFTHVILRHDGHIVSVLLDKSGQVPAKIENIDNPIVFNSEGSYQVAGFEAEKRMVFVVSDMTFSENLDTARALLNAWKHV